MIWKQSQALRLTPSRIIGLTDGSYEAYCFDQAVWYFGSVLESELEQAGHKRQKGEGQREAARKKILAKYLDEVGKPSHQQFADPAALFTS